MSYAQSIDGLNIEVTTGKVAESIDSLDTLLSTSEGAVQDGIVLLSPANIDINVSVTPSFDWDSSTVYDAYKILIDADETFSSPIEAYVTASDYAQTTALLSATGYFWKVVGGNVTDRPAIVPQVGINDSTKGDEESLRLIASALNYSGWYDKAGWSDVSMDLSQPIDRVTVQTINGELRVTGLDLLSNNCIGQLPEWPGLQWCERMIFKQTEDRGNTQGERITGPIPKSIGGVSKRITSLSLAGRRLSSGSALVIDDPSISSSSGNVKFGTAWNAYTGGFPDELQELTLEYFECSGMYESFGATLSEGWGANWNIKRINVSGNQWQAQNGTNGFHIKGEIPSSVNNWTECEYFDFGATGITGIALNAFEGWVPIGKTRRINVSNIDDDTGVKWDQFMPDMSRFSNELQYVSWSYLNIGFGGQEYPHYLHTSTNISNIYLVGHRFSTSQDLATFSNWGGSVINLASGNANDDWGAGYKMFQDGEDIGGYFNNRVKIWDVRYNSLGGDFPTGAHEFYQLRNIRFNSGDLGPNLPAKPPGEYSVSLANINFSHNKFNCPVPKWGLTAGSIEKFGGVITSGGPTVITHDIIDESGNNDEEWLYSITIQNAGFTPSEFAPESSTAPARVIILEARDSQGNLLYRTGRSIVTNTSDTITYEAGTLGSILNSFGNQNVEIDENTTWEIVRNFNTDDRPFNAFGLNQNDLYGVVPIEAAPVNMEYGGFSLAENRLTYKDIIPNLQAIEDLSTRTYIDNEGNTINIDWNYIYGNQKDFGEMIPGVPDLPDTIELSPGDTLRIDTSLFVEYEGNVYEWVQNSDRDNPLVNGGDITGADTNVLEIANMSEGNYTYRLYVSNPAAPGLPEIKSKLINVNVTTI